MEGPWNAVPIELNKAEYTGPEQIPLPCRNREAGGIGNLLNPLQLLLLHFITKTGMSKNGYWETQAFCS